ncbi:MAG: TrmH family RNA methyltransferase [Salinivirgaceae bacterium]|jgi:tRNA (guanosine-2'-O-)-methyltransferase|nr:TrmH family RNA methyltransferase [Salinivirgaceae bacterium]
MSKDIIQRLKSFMTEDRFKLFNNILDKRTNYITVGIEEIYQSHNASAVLRSCDCFGIQSVHVIEAENKFKPNPEVAMGASKWLSINQHAQENALETAINKLKKENYRIVATTPHTNDTELEAFDLEKGPVALLFGTEMRGLTQKAIDMADEHLKIPMYGFTESFNISVSVAIILHHLRMKLEASDIDWHISDSEKDALLLEWMKKSIKKSDAIIEKIEEQISKEGK